MVKHCSPFKLSGVVDSSFSGASGGSDPSSQAAEKAILWTGRLSPLTTPCAGQICLSLAQEMRESQMQVGVDTLVMFEQKVVLSVTYPNVQIDC